MYSLLSENKFHDFSTHNKSWLKYINHYVTGPDIGNKPSIERLEYNLIISDKSLIGVNPWDENLTPETQNAIMQELRINPVYLFREIIKDENDNYLRLNNAVMDILYSLSVGRNFVLNIPLYSQYSALIEASLLYMVIYRSLIYSEDISLLSNIKIGGHIKVPSFVEKLLSILDKFRTVDNIDKYQITKGNLIMCVNEPNYEVFSQNLRTFLTFAYNHDTSDCHFHIIVPQFEQFYLNDVNMDKISYDIIDLEINMDDSFNAFINYVKSKYDYDKLKIQDKISLFSKYVLKTNYYNLDTIGKLEVNKIFGTLYSKLSQ